MNQIGPGRNEEQPYAGVENVSAQSTLLRAQRKLFRPCELGEDFPAGLPCFPFSHTGKEYRLLPLLLAVSHTNYVDAGKPHQMKEEALADVHRADVPGPQHRPVPANGA